MLQQSCNRILHPSARKTTEMEHVLKSNRGCDCEAAEDDKRDTATALQQRCNRGCDCEAAEDDKRDTATALQQRCNSAATEVVIVRLQRMTRVMLQQRCNRAATEHGCEAAEDDMGNTEQNPPQSFN
jgi:hypothetical protein